jgi:hypothetical protein
MCRVVHAHDKTCLLNRVQKVVHFYRSAPIDFRALRDARKGVHTHAGLTMYQDPTTLLKFGVDEGYRWNKMLEDIGVRCVIEQYLLSQEGLDEDVRPLASEAVLGPTSLITTLPRMALRMLCMLFSLRLASSFVLWISPTQRPGRTWFMCWYSSSGPDMAVDSGRSRPKAQSV